MTNVKILEKAIWKAIDGGWTADWASKKGINVYYTGDYGGDKRHELIKVSEPEKFIFNHDFAKALWGEAKTSNTKPEGYIGAAAGVWTDVNQRGWQYHLQQMVVADDPLQYLKENI